MIKILKNLSLLKAFLLPGVAVVIWPVVFSLILNFPPGDSQFKTSVLNVIMIGLIILYTALLFIATLLSIRGKHYWNILALIFGTVLALGCVYIESIIIFAIGIAGGATG